MGYISEFACVGSAVQCIHLKHPSPVVIQALWKNINKRKLRNEYNFVIEEKKRV